MHICIVTSSQLSANPRVAKEAMALHNAGHTISIVCGDYIPGAAELDELVRHPEWVLRKVPFGRKVAPSHVHVRQRLSMAFARWLTRLGVKSASLETCAHAPIARDLVATACGVKADLYIAHYVAALPAAAEAASRNDAKFAFDAEDFHPGDRPDTAEHKLENQIIDAIERRNLPRAAYVTAAAPLIADAYSKAYRIPLPTTVLNVFPKNYAPASWTESGNAKPGPSVYWFSQTIGPGRGLEAAIEAIGIAKSRPHLYLRGDFAAGYRSVLLKFGENFGVKDRLHFLQPVPPDEVERLNAEYDLGYVGELAETTNRQIAVTNKLFSYLLGGLPSVASDIPSHSLLAPELGRAMKLFAKGDAVSLAASIDEFLLDSEGLSKARAHAYGLGQERFNWDLEQQKLQKIIASALG